MSFTSPFAKSIFLQKYSFNGTETWDELAYRVVSNVMGADKDASAVIELIKHRKFIPGGRYLYASGRPFHQVNNCFLFRAEDSREGWADALSKAAMSLQTGGGIGIDYSAVRPSGAVITRTGGTATGPVSLMQMINEVGRHVMQGGQRRSAIWAGLNWEHQDIKTFMHIKDYPDTIKQLKANDFTFPVPMELTNISVIYDTEFFHAIWNSTHPKHQLAKEIWNANCRQAFQTAEPGMAFNYDNPRDSLRNACVTGDTTILTPHGHIRIDSVVDTPTTVWNGFEWSVVTPKITGENQEMLKFSFSDGQELTTTLYHKFHISKGYHGQYDIIEAKDLKVSDKLVKWELPIIKEGKSYDQMYAQGFKSGDGMDGYNLIHVYEPKYMCIDRLGAYLVSEEEQLSRRKRVHVKGLLPKEFVPLDGDLKSKVDWLAGLLDADGCELKEGGAQIGGVDRGFLSKVQQLLQTLGVTSKLVYGAQAGERLIPDGHGGSKLFHCQETHRLCIGAVQMQDLIRRGLHCERLKFEKAPQRDASQFVRVLAIEEAPTASLVYCFNEPKRHTAVFNGVLTGQCTEVTSEDDSDKCNLGTLWMNRFSSKEEFAAAVKLATKFLLCGGIYSDVPTEKIKKVGLENNRIGLGLGGMHEFLMNRKSQYEVTPEMHEWLEIYRSESEIASDEYAKELGVARPKGVRAIAPTGTIGILAETTTGVEPLFCAAYLRRYFKEGKWLSQYVVDGAVKRLMESGVNPADIQDTYDLTFEERVKFQADVQDYVDMAISSTCNMPAWGSVSNNENTVDYYAKTLLKYAPRLRGFTCYPDGCRGGQPLTKVPLEEALQKEGIVFEEHETQCVGGVCGA